MAVPRADLNPRNDSSEGADGIRYLSGWPAAMRWPPGRFPGSCAGYAELPEGVEVMISTPGWIGPVPAAVTGGVTTGRFEGSFGSSSGA